MGPIQSSLNRLTLTAIGALAGGIKLAQGSSESEEEPKAESKQASAPKSETKSGMGNIAKVGRNKGNVNVKAYSASVKAMQSGNDAIAQKARAKFRPAFYRQEEIKKATSASFSESKGGSK